MTAGRRGPGAGRGRCARMQQEDCRGLTRQWLVESAAVFGRAAREESGELRECWLARAALLEELAGQLGPEGERQRLAG